MIFIVCFVFFNLIIYARWSIIMLNKENNKNYIKYINFYLIKYPFFRFNSQLFKYLVALRATKISVNFLGFKKCCVMQWNGDEIFLVGFRPILQQLDIGFLCTLYFITIIKLFFCIRYLCQKLNYDTILTHCSNLYKCITRYL